MHARRLSSVDDNGHVQESLGTADDDVHVVDDGPDHCMIGRPVGRAPDGCVYVLVARISLYNYEQLRDGDVEMAQAFADGRDISFCAVYEVDGIVENIALVRRFRHGDDVPAEYLPPSPFLEFADEDSPADEFADEDSPIDDAVADEVVAGGSEAAESGAAGGLGPPGLGGRRVWGRGGFSARRSFPHRRGRPDRRTGTGESHASRSRHRHGGRPPTPAPHQELRAFSASTA